MEDAFRSYRSTGSNSTLDSELFCCVAGHGMTISKGTNEQAIPGLNNVSVGIEAAVEVRHAYKAFGTRCPVLEDLNMTVEAGSIYSLLGSSGCGKTTLLLCCVGLQKLDRGTIKVFSKPPGTNGSGVPGHKVGYMPQDLSLYEQFSIHESLTYFGRLYGMSNETIKESMDSILKLLDLPSASRRVCTLSGGQRRRVSFAIATFHKPQLLILDEPTVGVDPVLRESIWTFLRQLVATRKTTVIITTHYIEEARQSNTVGVMRNGRLLVENSPQELMAQFKLPLLEQIVLTLCQNDSKPSPSPYDRQKKWRPFYTPDYSKKYAPSSNIFAITGKEGGGLEKKAFAGKCDKESNSKSSCASSTTAAEPEVSCSEDMSSTMQRINALVIKDFLVLLRSVWFLLFIFVVPALQIVLICLAIGPDPKELAFGVINEELMAYETDLNTTALCDVGTGCGVALSCRYLATLPKESLNLISYENISDAIEDIKGGKIWGYIYFPANYSAYLIDRGGNPAFALDETYDGSRITFEMDMSNQQIGYNLKKIIIDAFHKFLLQVILDCNFNPRQVELPLNFKEPVYGSDGTSFSEFLAPSVFLGLLFFFPLCSSGISYISEKKSGMLNRCLVSGVTASEIMVAFLISQLAVLIIQSGLAFLILNVVFKIPILGSVPLGLTLAVLVGIGGMSMGFLISVICKEEIHAVLLAIGSFFPNFLLAGMVWPIQGMPIVLQYIAYLLPCTLACESMRSIVSRGWAFLHPSVWPGFASTLGWIFIYWTLTLLIHRHNTRH